MSYIEKKYKQKINDIFAELPALEEDLVGLLNQNSIAGVAIGRAARGNPQIFQKKPINNVLGIYDRLIAYMKGTSYFNPFNLRLQSADFLKHFRYAANARKEILTLNQPEAIIEKTRDLLEQ